ncbi:hypothetical protein IMCC21906_01346 [Spongiibacter sp. IMCC21906]|nr:hypothetical protein IMCC21906_01346 [Spongiibacter sp. IMCC21906]
MQSSPYLLKNKPLLIVFGLWMLVGTLIVYGGMKWLTPLMYIIFPVLAYLFWKGWRAAAKHISEGFNRDH